jgi:hypothetical protein
MSTVPRPYSRGDNFKGEDHVAGPQRIGYSMFRSETPVFIDLLKCQMSAKSPLLQNISTL